MSGARGMRPIAVESTESYLQRFDYDANGNAIYLGRADIGSLSSEAKWQIKRLSYSGSNVTIIEFASSTDAFNQAWDSRTSLTYG